MENIDQQIEALKTKIAKLEFHASQLTTSPFISDWDRGHVENACARIKRKMEKELKVLLIAQIKSGTISYGEQAVKYRQLAEQAAEIERQENYGGTN